MRGEFELIASLYAPLSAGAPGAFGLRNDGALIELAAGEQSVVTVDAMVEGVHYLPDDPADAVAQKLLRVNLSDLAAMGAEPRGYLLATCLGPTIDDAWLERFVAGLAADQKSYGVTLLGGDTTRTPGPTCLSLTAFGAVPTGRCLERSTLRPGELLYVSGTIGDAALGLDLLQGRLELESEADRAFLAGRYRLPRPRTLLGPALLGLASAGLDVSDGLVADAGHLAEESRVGIEIETAAVPLSAAARAALDARPELLARVLTGGDDYELLFGVAEARAAAVPALAARLGLPLTRIGRAVAAERGTVRVLDAEGRPLTLGRGGWTHF
ncbi:thiamine-phosphate kinase [Tistlia consotensis]|uniref:Thiamine-monophosphate kinase n=1 Tax=Tistlia consotensis USBA 355 TaxID=560819 RepID=A0A1Y6BVT6_9PROT|nr:thiamine-phosphate kinase [Tistlia consotensis]SMF20910.1 thiamine-phosphate kinase [Tistlia consotensis USBA 355]SNR47401.1 thiamine-phosphate kinase [Tistlia consotensis]